ncbi:MAG: hypothetical protein ACOCV2_01450 [Persicimonas sp.]
MMQGATRRRVISVLVVACVALIGLFEPPLAAIDDDAPDSKPDTSGDTGGLFYVTDGAPVFGAERLVQEGPTPLKDSPPEKEKPDDPQSEEVDDEDRSQDDENDEELDKDKWRPPSRGSGGDDPPDYIKPPDPELV